MRGTDSILAQGSWPRGLRCDHRWALRSGEKPGTARPQAGGQGSAQPHFVQPPPPPPRHLKQKGLWLSGSRELDSQTRRVWAVGRHCLAPQKEGTCSRARGTSCGLAPTLCPQSWAPWLQGPRAAWLGAAASPSPGLVSKRC